MNAVTMNLGSSLTALDWQVVDMAKADGPRSIAPEGPITALLRDLFGLPLPRKLASTRLEALRRFSVRAWFWDVIRNHDMRTLIDGGYTSVDVSQILAHVAGVRGFVPSIEE